MTEATNIAGLTLARKLLNDDRAAFVQCHIVPEAGLSADDQAIADDYTAAIAAITGAAAELQRLSAERDELAAKYDELLVALHSVGSAIGIEEADRSPYSIACGVLVMANKLAAIERAEPARELPNSITAAIADFRDACIACAISECSDHDRDPDYTSADQAEECLRAELQRLTAERDELAARLAEIAAQPPERPLYPFNVPLDHFEDERWKRIAENAQAVTTGGEDKGDYFEVPAHLMAALALALDEWPGAQGQAGAASMGTKIRPAAAPDRAELAQAREVLRYVEWLPGDLRPDEPRWCMVCMSYEPHHAPDCKLNAALAAKE